MTVDAYRIKISDQIYATTLIDVTPEIEAAMTAAGIEGAGSIDQLNYFQNAFDSTVQGVDVVASYRANLIEVNPTKIGRAHVCTPVTNSHLVCRLLLDKKYNFYNFFLPSYPSHPFLLFYFF